jgi:predicted site-specific integrase-resolvase
MARMLTRKQAANHLGVSYSTLCRWAYTGIGPNFVQVGKQPRYRISDIEDYLSSQTIAH